MAHTKANKVEYSVDGRDVCLSGSWRLNATEDHRSLYRTLDVILNVSPAHKHRISTNNHLATQLSTNTRLKTISSPKNLSRDATQENINTDLNETSQNVPKIHPLVQESRASDFLVRLLDRSESGPFHIAVKLLLPSQSGFCVRSDFLERRLEGYEHILNVESFLRPRQEIKASDFLIKSGDSSASNLLTLFSYAIGAVQVDDEKHLGDLEKELVNRLSFPWISSEPIAPTRIAWIKGKDDLEASRRIWEAARATGIEVVVIDHEGHWLQKDDSRWKHLREGFIPTDITVDEGFVDRIVAAVRSYDKPIDGVVTVSNARIVGAAQACEILGLPTTPPEPFIIAADKFRSREIEPDDGGAFRVFSVDELHARLSSETQALLEYPLVIKPCMGWGSECVSKVHSQDELVQAVKRASDRHSTGSQHRTDVMIEPYIDGPEVDANFVLIDGEIVFFEVADDFPSPGDDAGNPWQANFIETANLLPTALTPREVQITKKSLHQSILRQGFRTGVFHCEGRIRYSSKAYDTRDGLHDLYPRESGRGNREPSFYLHEINARPGGYLVSVATLLTYGVDYYAIHMLAAVGDLARCRALSVPFARGAQWWLQVIVIQEDKQGVMKTADAGKEMLDRNPDLRAAVVDYRTCKKKGDRLLGPTSDVFSYLAYFSVVSRKSREDCLKLSDKVRREFKYEVE